MLMELRHNAFANFLTLTYAERSRPETLDVRHIQLFLKHFRESSQIGVRYFCVGEYGARTKRPHWHMITFHSTPLPMGRGLQHIRSWPHGGVLVGDVAPGAIAYVAKYALKGGVRGKEFVTLMSRRPGIGLPMLEELGSRAALVTPVLPKIPGLLNVGDKRLPLDRQSMLAFRRGFLASGGVLEQCETTPNQLDREAHEVLRLGDPFANLTYEQSLLRTQNVRSIEDGSF